MNLLTVGLSLSEARERPHRYKLLNGALPTFGNPTAPSNRNFDMGTAPRSGGEVGQKAETEPMKTESVAAVAEKEAPMNVFPAGRWTIRANPFKSEKPTPRPTVQGELSLDKVKPLRNDLSDCDLELAPSKPAELSTVKVGEMEVPVVKVQPLWARVSALFQRKQ
jgi:hypothetical protein